MMKMKNVMRFALLAVMLAAYDTANTAGEASAGLYLNNSAAPLVATPNVGFAFVNCTENGRVVSNATSSYTFTNLINRSLVANFAAVPQSSFLLSQLTSPALNWPVNEAGFVLRQNSDFGTTNWVTASNAVSVVGTSSEVIISLQTNKGFFRLTQL